MTRSSSSCPHLCSEFSFLSVILLRGTSAIGKADKVIVPRATLHPANKCCCFSTERTRVIFTQQLVDLSVGHSNNGRSPLFSKVSCSLTNLLYRNERRRNKFIQGCAFVSTLSQTFIVLSCLDRLIW